MLIHVNPALPPNPGSSLDPVQEARAKTIGCRHFKALRCRVGWFVWAPAHHGMVIPSSPQPLTSPCPPYPLQPALNPATPSQPGRSSESAEHLPPLNQAARQPGRSSEVTEHLLPLGHLLCRGSRVPGLSLGGGGEGRGQPACVGRCVAGCALDAQAAHPTHPALAHTHHHPLTPLTPSTRSTHAYLEQP